MKNYFLPKAIFYDFDGVMTNNCVVVCQDGSESVVCNRSDGYAIARIRDMGIIQAIITTEENPVVKKRADKLGIPVFLGSDNKGETLLKCAKKEGISLELCCFVGNDINDIPAFDLVGLCCAPKDAELEIIDRADWISTRNGGEGVVRDLYRFLCRIKEGEQL